jgi:glycosyltransferase involved in cell wall biosynthesis
MKNTVIERSHGKHKPGSEKLLLMAGSFQPPYVRDLANAFGEAGVSVLLIGSDRHRHIQFHENVQFLNLRGNDSPERSFHRKVFELGVYYFRLLRYLRGSGLSLMYTIGTVKPFIYGIVFNTLIKMQGKTVVHTVHNLLPHDRPTLVNKLLYWTIYRIVADHLVTHTDFLKDQLVRRFRVPERKVTVAQHGTYRVSAVEQTEKKKARQLLDIATDKFVLLCFGKQYPYKGFHFLLQCLSGLEDRSLHVLIQGQADSAYQARMRSLISDLKNPGMVEYDPTFVTDEKTRLLFTTSDLVVFPYFEPSQSGVMFLAYAYGRPVLASDIGSFPRYIVPGRTGELFETGNRRSLLRKLELIRGAYTKYDEAYIRNHAYSRYSWAGCVHTLLKTVLHSYSPPELRDLAS